MRCAGGGHGKGGDREGDGKRGGRDKRGKRSDRRDLERERERERDLDQDGANQFASRFQSIEEVLGQVRLLFAPLHHVLCCSCLPKYLFRLPCLGITGSHARIDISAEGLFGGMLSRVNMWHSRDVFVSCLALYS